MLFKFFQYVSISAFYFFLSPEEKFKKKEEETWDMQAHDRVNKPIN